MHIQKRVLLYVYSLLSPELRSNYLKLKKRRHPTPSCKHDNQDWTTKLNKATEVVWSHLHGVVRLLALWDLLKSNLWNFPSSDQLHRVQKILQTQLLTSLCFYNIEIFNLPSPFICPGFGQKKERGWEGREPLQSEPTYKWSCLSSSEFIKKI